MVFNQNVIPSFGPFPMAMLVITRGSSQIQRIRSLGGLDLCSKASKTLRRLWWMMSLRMVLEVSFNVYLYLFVLCLKSLEVYLYAFHV